jgi:hypothetical protein
VFASKSQVMDSISYAGNKATLDLGDGNFITINNVADGSLGADDIFIM